MKMFSLRWLGNYCLLALLCAALVKCASKPYATSNKLYRKQTKALAKTITQYPLMDSSSTIASEFVGTTNFNLRKPNFVIIHHTAQNSCEQTLKTFTLTRTQVSAHYVVCRNGTVHHMLNDYLRAWHGGVSKWGNNSDINSSSIGIEIDNNGSEPFSESQISSVLELLGRLKKAYGIPTANFVGHADIAPGRKVDPSNYFPWQQLAQQGYGLWYDTTAISETPPDFNTLQALRIIGYDVKKPADAIYSYHLHFVPQDTTHAFSERDKKIVFSLMQKSINN
jgi:N-acetylmuramoyl-L-alanine amidase